MGIAGLAMMLAGGGLVGGEAAAQRIVQRGPRASHPVRSRAPVIAPRPGIQDHRRGSHVHAPGDRHASRWRMQDGRWTAGWNAPGGWSGYRRPYRGWALPRYWVQPSFVVADWATYGLAQPPSGYRWSRYYDDAVLIDARGASYDMVGGIDWDGPHADYGHDGDDARSVAPHCPPPPGEAPPSGDRSRPAGGGTVVTTTAGGYGGGTTTTVVGSTAPMVTTTTEIGEDAPTCTPAGRRPASRRAMRR